MTADLYTKEIGQTNKGKVCTLEGTTYFAFKFFRLHFNFQQSTT